MERRVFDAMGTTVEAFVEAVGEPARVALASVESEFRRLESKLSRFDAGSELSRLNRDGRIAASGELLELTRLALDARAQTAGRFDPTVHDAIVSAGYDRSLAAVVASPPPAGPARPAGGAVTIDAVSGLIELGPGARLDLGGIAKGWAVDRTCMLLAEHGPCLVNAGGDLAVRGAPRGGAWPVAVETPDGRLVLGLSRGALATSGTDRRRWGPAGDERHHLIDPTSGRPSRSDLLRITVVAGSATDAEIWATALQLVGADAAMLEADRRRLACVAITTDGRVLRAGALA